MTTRKPLKASVAGSLQALGAKVNAAKEGGAMHEIATDMIDVVFPNRNDISDDSVKEMSESIHAVGVQQPILVRPGKVAGRFDLIAGERRLRGSKLAGRKTIPARVKHVTDDEARTLQGIENIHRLNWTQLEEAQHLQAALDAAKRSGSRQPLDAVAKQWAKSKSWVSERISLLNLTKPAKALMDDAVTADMTVITSVHRAAKLNSKAGEALAQQVRTTDKKRETARAGYENIKRSSKGATAPAKGKGPASAPGALHRYAEILHKAAYPTDKPNHAELARRVRSGIDNTEPGTHKAMHASLQQAHKWGKQLRKSGPPHARTVSADLLKGLDAVAADAKAWRTLLLKAFAAGVTGQAFEFEAVVIL